MCSVKHLIPSKYTNYQYIIDISAIGIIIYDGKLLYSTIIPELEVNRFQHSIPIPQKQGLNFVALIPEMSI